MSHGEAEKPQPPGGESDLPAGNSSLKEAEKEITNALKKGSIEQENIVKERARIPGEIPHARERLIFSGIALAASIFAAVMPITPDSVRGGMLSIATIIVTALVKPFEKNG